MKIHEVLNFNREMLMKFKECGIKVDDCKYIDLYNDYDEMKAKGYKVTYIISVLSDIYHISDRKVYDVIKKFSMDCTIRSLRKG